MNIEKLGKVVLSIYDELAGDSESQNIVDALDLAGSDRELESAIERGLARIEKLGKVEVAKRLRREIGL